MNKKEYAAISNFVMLELNTIHNVSSIKDLIDDETAILPTLYELQKEGLIEIVTQDEQGIPITWKITEKGLDVKYLYGSYDNWKRRQRIKHKVSCAVVAILAGLLFALICKIFLT